MPDLGGCEARSRTDECRLGLQNERDEQRSRNLSEFRACAPMRAWKGGGATIEGAPPFFREKQDDEASAQLENRTGLQGLPSS